MISPPGALVDANVVLRFLTRVPAGRSEAAARLFARGQRGDVALLLLPLVVAEVVHVLEGVYDYRRERVQRELAELFDAECFTIRDGDVIRRALRRRVTTSVDFVDAYLAEMAQHEGLGVATFDDDFDRLGVARMQET